MGSNETIPNEQRNVAEGDDNGGRTETVQNMEQKEEEGSGEGAQPETHTAIKASYKRFQRVRTLTMPKDLSPEMMTEIQTMEQSSVVTNANRPPDHLSFFADKRFMIDDTVELVEAAQIEEIKAAIKAREEEEERQRLEEEAERKRLEEEAERKRLEEEAERKRIEEE